jgi:hypothetical protein
MNVPPIQTNKPQPTFGIYKVSQTTHYGHRDTCLLGIYKNNIKKQVIKSQNDKLDFTSGGKSID